MVKKKVAKKATKKKVAKKKVTKAKSKGGRPTKLNETIKTVAYNLYKKGWTDAQVAEVCDVSEGTINNWKKADPEFFKSMKEAKADPDKQVEEALFNSAIGYEYEQERAMTVSDGKDLGSHIEKVKEQKWMPGDVRAQQFWLKNRKADKWKDKQEVDVSASDDFAASILRARKRLKGEGDE